jgi:hypothetical protein
VKFNSNEPHQHACVWVGSQRRVKEPVCKFEKNEKNNKNLMVKYLFENSDEMSLTCRINRE